MGKSQRIRDERAASIASNPDKHLKTNKDKKTGRALTITFVAIAVLLVAIAVIVILNQTGSFTRMQVAASSENFTVNGNMMAYYYSTVYSTLYNQESMYSQYLGTEVNASKVAANALATSKTNIKTVLALCEAAKKESIELTEVDKVIIEKTIESLNEQASYYSSLYGINMSIGDVIGNSNVKENDVRDMATLLALADRFVEIKKEGHFDEIISSDEALKKYIDENKATVYMADYLTYSVKTEEEAKSIILAKTPEEFKSLIITHYVENNYQTQLDKLKLDAKAPVKELSAALKHAIIEELKFSLLDIKIEGLELKEDGERVDRIKAIFEKLYAGKTFTAEKDEKGVTTVSDDLFKSAATVGTALSTSANSAVNTATKTGAAYSLIEETEDKKNADSDKWIFADGRKENEANYFAVTNTSGETTTTTYTVVFMVKPMYIDTESVRSVGHILFKANLTTITDKMTAEQKAEAEKKNEAAFAEQKAEADKIYAEFLAGDKSLESFEIFGEKYTDDSSVFYDSVRKGDMVKEFEDWLFAEGRKVGDTGVVKTEYGYHIMYFVEGDRPAWKVTAANYYSNDEYNSWFDELKLDDIVTVNAGVIHSVLGVEPPAETTAAVTTTAPTK